MIGPGKEDTLIDKAAPFPVLAPPHSFIDAGDVPWLELAPLLEKGLTDLRPGEVLEVQSGDPATIMALPGWCAGEGHTLLDALPGDGHVSFWIGKNP